MIDTSIPAYCGFCGKSLIERDMEDGYNIYTGEKIMKPFILCPTLSQSHDIWERVVILESVTGEPVMYDWKQR